MPPFLRQNYEVEASHPAQRPKTLEKRLMVVRALGEVAAQVGGGTVREPNLLQSMTKD